MKVELLKELRWAPDGIHIELLAAGTEHEIPDPLAMAWITAGLAAPVTATRPAAAGASTQAMVATDVRTEVDDKAAGWVADAPVEMTPTAKRIVPRTRPRRGGLR